MHRSNFRPTRWQQITIAAHLKKNFPNQDIVVHHVIEDTPTKCVVQVEVYNPITKRVLFTRVKL